MARNPTQNDLELGGLGKLPQDAVKRRKFILHKNTDRNAAPIEAPIGDLLKEIAGRDIDLSNAEAVYMANQLRALLKDISSSDIAAYCRDDFRNGEEGYARYCYFAREVIETMRKNPGISIARTIYRLQQSNVIKSKLEEDPAVIVRNSIFSAIGIASQVFVPVRTKSKDHFKIDTQGASCPSKTTVDFDKAQRPWDELLRGFGEIFPRKSSMNGISIPVGTQPLKYHVSSLNAATLRRIAGVKIMWVDSISSHLDFDSTIPALYLFRKPSFCMLQASEGSLLSM